jgi:hypothetical protein
MSISSSVGFYERSPIKDIRHAARDQASIDDVKLFARARKKAPGMTLPWEGAEVLSARPLQRTPVMPP